MALPSIDFNGDGKRDLLWRNYITGTNLAWSLNRFFTPGSRGSDIPLGIVGDVNWTIVGAADIDGDGKSNLFWRYTGTNPNLVGTNLIWKNLTDGAGSISLPRVADLNWRVESVIDIFPGTFNFTGMYWRNYSNGQNLLWLLNDGVKLDEIVLPSVPDLNWEIAAVDDFNQDFIPDIVWRNYATGQNVIWHLDSEFNRSYDSVLQTVADRNWRIEGAGDFNDDDKADILWRNVATGQTLAWKMTNLFPVRTDITPRSGTISSDWKLISGTADFNGDNDSDLLWWNSNSGQLLSWFLDRNGQYIGERFINRSVPGNTGWKPISATPNGVRAGGSIISWHNEGAGKSLFWRLDSTNYASEVTPSISATAVISGYKLEDAFFVDSSVLSSGVGLLVFRNYSSFNASLRGTNLMEIVDATGKLLSTKALPVVADLNWKVVDIFDYNEDSIFDLMWWNKQSGEVGVWLFKDSNFLNYDWISLAKVPDTNWELIDSSGLIGDGGFADLLWRNYTTGQTAIWQMDGATRLGDLAITPVVPSNSGWAVI
jgi:hypothetical protein